MLACLVDIVRILGGLKREIIVRRFSPPRILTTKPLPVSTHKHTQTHTNTHKHTQTHTQTHTNTHTNTHKHTNTETKSN